MKYIIAILTIVTSISSCIIRDVDDMAMEAQAIPEMMRYTIKVNSIEAIKSCEGDGTSGKGDIYTKITLHKNDTPNGSSWGVLAETSEVVVEIARGETIDNPSIEVSKDIVPFDGMRVEYIMKVREVDPSSTQVQELFTHFMVYDGQQFCFVEETFMGVSDVCLAASVAGSSTYQKTNQARLVDHNCDVIITYTVSLNPI